MTEPVRRPDDAVWSYIKAERFSDAKVAVDERIAQADPADAGRLWELFGLLGSVLNSLGRTDEATAALRRAMAEARRVGPSRPEVSVSRYLLANQHLLYGDPALALTEATPIPDGKGDIECLLHSVKAQALWKLGRTSEAQQAARDALGACPTANRLSQLSDELACILEEPTT